MVRRSKQQTSAEARRDFAQRREQIGRAEFRRRCNHLTAVVLDNDGAPQVKLGNRALDRGLVAVAKQA